MIARFTLIAIALLASGAAHAQGLVFSTSDPTVNIHSTFTGETMTLFGNIEPDLTGARPEGSYDVIMVVRGPVADRVVRRKARQFGIMLNADYAFYADLPSFYRLVSSRPVAAILDADTLTDRLLTTALQAEASLRETTGDGEQFNAELIRLMERANLFRTNERGVAFLSPTLFTARINLPANVPSGVFLAQTFIVQNGEVVAQRAQRFMVQKIGFERFLGEASRNQSLLYGLACVCLALFTGWLGGVLFRR